MNMIIKIRVIHYQIKGQSGNIFRFIKQMFCRHTFIIEKFYTSGGYYVTCEKCHARYIGWLKS